MACGLSRSNEEKQKHLVSYLILKRHVPIDAISEEELALDEPGTKHVVYNRSMTPLLSTIFSENEGLGLFLLSLRPEVELKLGVTHKERNNILLRAAETVPRMVEALLRRSDVKLFFDELNVREDNSNTLTCYAASNCMVDLLR